MAPKEDECKRLRREFDQIIERMEQAERMLEGVIDRLERIEQPSFYFEPEKEDE